MNVLTPQQKSTVVTLLQNNITQREIERKTGIDRKTIRKLAREMAAAAAANSSTPATGSVSPPGQIPSPWPPALAAPALTPAALPIPAHARSGCEPHRAWIETQVGLGRNATTIYQELVDERGFTKSITAREHRRCIRAAGATASLGCL